MRLIDANRLIELYEGLEDRGLRIPVETAIQNINDMPTINTEEMRVQIIYADGREMIIDGIEDYNERGEYWELTDINGNHSYVTDKIKYIGRPAVKTDSLGFMSEPEKRKLLGLL